MPLAEEIEKRGLTPSDVFLASFLGGMYELGVINQAVVNLASEIAERSLAEYAKAKGAKTLLKSEESILEEV